MIFAVALIFLCMESKGRAACGYPGDLGNPAVADSVKAEIADGAAPVDTVPAGSSGWQKFKKFFTESNKEKEDKKFDFGIIGGPHYSNDVKFGLGVVASGLYSLDRSDPALPKSNVSIYGDVSTTGFYLLGVRGDNFFPGEKYRLSYTLYTFSFPIYFWGIGYRNASDDRNKSQYKSKVTSVGAEFLIKVAGNFYIGPNVNVDYVYGKDIERPEFLGGQKNRLLSPGVGFSLMYDTRDVITSAYQGMFLKLGQMAYPEFLGNKYAFGRTEVITDFYQPLWKGAVLAADFHAELNYGDIPWTMVAWLGGSNRMRGYYDGQYRDNNLAEAQMELRQHIYNRHGAVVWIGAGNVFRNFKSIRLNQTLPNYGIGYRWEFKKRVNIRLDYGFGKGQSGFLFQINEAF